MVRFIQIQCADPLTDEWHGYQCPPGVHAGTLYEVFVSAVCQPDLVSPDRLSDVLDLLNRTEGVYAVFRPAEPYGIVEETNADVVAVLDNGDDLPPAILGFQEGRLVEYRRGCAPLAEILAGESDYLLPPRSSP